MHARAAGPSTATASSLILQRFLTVDDPSPVQYRALRHLDAENEHFDSNAWMDVWTEADQAGGFRYHVVSEGFEPKLFEPAHKRELIVLEWRPNERSLLRGVFRALEELPDWELLLLRTKPLAGRPTIPRSTRSGPATKASSAWAMSRPRTESGSR